MIAFLLSLTALIAYGMGSLRTDIIVSNLLHKNLLSYTRDNLGITRFERDFGRKGFALILITEILKTLIPVLLGGLLLSIKDQGDIGRAFALFCVMLGTRFPIMYGFVGERSLIVMGVGLLCIKFGIGVLIIALFAGVYRITRYVSLASLIATAFMCMLTFILLDGVWVHRLLLLCAVIVLIEYRKSIVRLIKKTEPKFIYRRDLSYMFDEK